MRNIVRYFLLIVVAAVLACTTAGCFRTDLMFEDGDFDGVEFSDYDLMHNAELEMDDVDRE